MHDHVVNERENNRKIVEYFFTIGGTKRLEIYHEDGIKDLPFLPASLKAVGIEALRAHHELSAKRFPEWQWSDVKIISTEDPGLFFVLSNGSGTLLLETGPVNYENKYVLIFKVRDGKISELIEYNDPLKLLKAAGGKIVAKDKENEIIKLFEGLL